MFNNVWHCHSVSSKTCLEFVAQFILNISSVTSVPIVDARRSLDVEIPRGET